MLMGDFKLQDMLARLMDDEDFCLPMAMREIPLSLEAAQEILRRLNDPSEPTHSGREMPMAGIL